MKGVFQPTPTSCCPACIASIFEIPIEDIPELPDNELWTDELNKWLKHKGLYTFSIRFSNREAREFLKGYSLGGIESSRLPGEMHCVVCYDGRIVWDPIEGEKGGTEYPDRWEIFIAIDPNKLNVK